MRSGRWEFAGREEVREGVDVFPGTGRKKEDRGKTSAKPLKKGKPR